MTNVEINASQVDGGSLPQLFEEGEACKFLVERIAGDDTGAPVRNLEIVVKTASGKTVVVIIPNDNASMARVLVDGVQV